MAGLILVGYRGCGKSTVAVAVSEALGWPIADCDALIEQRAGCPIPQIFAEHGEAVFRDHEAAVLAKVLAQSGPQVIATGGGVVERADNRSLLVGADNLVVYLSAPATALAARLAANAGDRPSLTGAGVADEVQTMLTRRDPWYRAVADVVIDAEQSPSAVAAAVVAAVVGDAVSDVEKSDENASDC